MTEYPVVRTPEVYKGMEETTSDSSTRLSLSLPARDVAPRLGYFSFCVSRFRCTAPAQSELLVQLVGSFSHHPLLFLTCLSPSGDSLSKTGFEINGTQPSVGNPLGNPPYPVRGRFRLIDGVGLTHVY